ncbi:hypothetical protein [Stieleria mannarensis]|uniref:hypothetical protein n=1 Tax=Stieleria mannarensis TaxID=2755585 RepID=UPI001C717FC3|nr:hypothetical protein [Rhodopirellula sp. JC639]
MEDYERTDLNFYCPTPEEIAAKCREIQAGWTVAERRARMSLEHCFHELTPAAIARGQLAEQRARERLAEV